MVIPAIQGSEDEQKISLLLRAIRGVGTLAISSQIVWLTYCPDLVSMKAIFEILKAHNFSPSDSLDNGHWITA